MNDGTFLTFDDKQADSTTPKITLANSYGIHAVSDGYLKKRRKSTHAHQAAACLAFSGAELTHRPGDPIKRLMVVP